MGRILSTDKHKSDVNNLSSIKHVTDSFLTQTNSLDFLPEKAQLWRELIFSVELFGRPGGVVE